MKNFCSIFGLMFAIISYSHLAHAEQNVAPEVEYVQHIVLNNCFVNNDSWSKIRYELTEPSGVIHKGNIYPGTESINLDRSTSKLLSGIYVLRYSFCGGSFIFPDCHSYSASVNVQHNTHVVWELNLDGMKFSQTDL